MLALEPTTRGAALGEIEPDVADSPVLNDVPVGDLQLPRAEFMAVLPKLPWVRPQEGLIGS